MAAERAKYKLSKSENATVAVKNFYKGKDLVVTLTRDLFESLSSELFSTCLTCLERVLVDAHLTKEEVSAIILVGGSTRIPKLREKIGDWFGRPPSHDVDPITAVCEGAAIQAGILNGLIKSNDLTHVTLLDITPLSFWGWMYLMGLWRCWSRGTARFLYRSRKRTPRPEITKS